MSRRPRNLEKSRSIKPNCPAKKILRLTSNFICSTMERDQTGILSGSANFGQKTSLRSPWQKHERQSADMAEKSQRVTSKTPGEAWTTGSGENVVRINHGVGPIPNQLMPYTPLARSAALVAASFTQTEPPPPAKLLIASPTDSKISVCVIR